MANLEVPEKVCCYREVTDMRKSINGLLSVVNNKIKANSYEKLIFIFQNRAGNYLKALYWDRTGYVLICKKLERGRFSWLSEGENLNDVNLRLLFDGVLRRG